MEPVLIYTDPDRVDAGATRSFDLDLAFGSDENDFALTMGPPALSGGELVYVDGTEYGGIVDGRVSSSGTRLVSYRGRTFHGILASAVVEPPAGESHWEFSGDANALVASLVDHVGLGWLFRAREGASGIPAAASVRYADAYSALAGALGASGARLAMRCVSGTVECWAEPARLHEASSAVSLEVTESHRRPNHLVCLGTGEGAERLVRHLYADADGSVSASQTLFGADEWTVAYDYPQAGEDELVEAGTKRLRELQSSGGVEASVTGRGEWGVGDLLEASDDRIGARVTVPITKKIVRVSAGAMRTTYEVGSRLSSSSAADPSGGGSSGGGGTAYVGGWGITVTGSIISADGDAIQTLLEEIPASWVEAL